MDFKKYKIVCLNCGGSNEAIITEPRPNEFSVDLNTDHKRNPDRIFIISARYRNMGYGWECICGATSILAREELPEIRNIVTGGGEEAIAKLADSLKLADDKKFKMYIV